MPFTQFHQPPYSQTFSLELSLIHIYMAGLHAVRGFHLCKEAVGPGNEASRDHIGVLHRRLSFPAVQMCIRDSDEGFAGDALTAAALAHEAEHLAFPNGKAHTCLLYTSFYVQRDGGGMRRAVMDGVVGDHGLHTVEALSLIHIYFFSNRSNSFF